MQGTSKQIRRAFRYAFPHTIPIFAGFWFLGITYGVYMNVSGFSFVYPMLMSMTIFTGSMEFVTVNMLLSGFHPLQAFVMAILVGARHLFYGISISTLPANLSNFHHRGYFECVRDLTEKATWLYATGRSYPFLRLQSLVNRR